MAYFMTFRPLWGVYVAQEWVSTPCQIISSELKRQGKGSVRLEVVFDYRYDGRDYQSNQYCFMSISSNTSRAWKTQAVQSHPAGKESTCFVDPNDPASAVIDRGWVPDMWWGLFPIPFLLIGGVVFLGSTGSLRSSSAKSTGDWRPETESDSDSDDEYESPYRRHSEQDAGPVTLKPETTPLQMLIGSAIAALFVNGILALFVWEPIQQFRAGGLFAMNWFTTLFMVPFVAIGLGLIAFFLYSFLALFNPRPTLVVSSAAIPLGEELRVNWMLSGRVDSIRELRISLKGVEKATYRRGTNTATDQSIFARIPIVETTQSFDMGEGSATIAIPVDTMHSFSAANNKIEWTINVCGEIPWWPDVAASFPITVLPLPIEAE